MHIQNADLLPLNFNATLARFKPIKDNPFFSFHLYFNATLARFKHAEPKHLNGVADIYFNATLARFKLGKK